VKKATADNQTIVIAIGGNSLIKNGNQSACFQEQLETVQETTQNIAEIVRQGHRIVITHGNGPQVGDVLIRSYLTRTHMPDIPLDMANAITQSEIGYMLQQSLKNQLLKRKLVRDVVTVITQVEVDKKDPAFVNYTKPVGPFYSKKEAFALQVERKWTMKEDAGRGFRRLVSSPQPKQIIEINEIRSLVQSNVIVIAAGGGGIPVFQNTHRQLVPLSAVIDKDLTSALLADLIDADILLISTSIDRAYIDFNKPQQKPLLQITVKQAQELLNQAHFGQGSMEPKIKAGIMFLSNRKARQTIITNPTNLSKAINNKKIGTRITN
jgi:carbamate kinase